MALGSVHLVQYRAVAIAIASLSAVVGLYWASQAHRTSRATKSESSFDSQKKQNSPKDHSSGEQKSETVDIDSSAQATRLKPYPETLGSETPSREVTTCSQDVDQSEDKFSEVSGSDDDPFEDFQPVIRLLDIEALKDVAIAARLTSQQPSSSLPTTCFADQLSCDISKTPEAGSYNLVYFINFSDGIRWVARISGRAGAFEDLDRRKMDQEYQTMRWIRAQTSIPIPEVFMWETNGLKVGVPFALMSFIAGAPLGPKWFDQSWFSEEQRMSILEQIAKAMSQFQKVAFGKIGSLVFNDRGAVVDIGPTYQYCSNWNSSVASDSIVGFGPWESYDQYQLDTADDLCPDPNIQGDCAWPYVDATIIGIATLTIPPYMHGNGRFFLAPPDLNPHNILVNEDGKITGYIDWDEVRTAPCAEGCGAYPSWLTVDWDPQMYGYHADEDPASEYSPEELSRYRRHYAKIFEGFNLSHYDARETRLSHILEAIMSARGNRTLRPGIARKLVDHAFHGNVPFEFRDFAMSHQAGEAYETLERIGEAFRNMWRAEWERP